MCSHFQKLEIFIRVRLPWRIHAELRARHHNISTYIRNLILEDLHKKPKSAFKPFPPEKVFFISLKISRNEKHKIKGRIKIYMNSIPNTLYKR